MKDPILANFAERRAQLYKRYSINSVSSGIDRNLAPMFIAVGTVMFTASTAILGCRLFTRILLPHGSGLDDASLALAQVC